MSYDGTYNEYEKDPLSADEEIEAEDIRTEDIRMEESKGTLDMDAVTFNDGKKQIDFILVYEENPNADQNTPNANVPKKVIKEMHRDSFLSQLKTLGLDIEEEIDVISEKRVIHFIKVHARWKILCHFAEYLNLTVPIMESDFEDKRSWIGDKCFRIFSEDVPNKPAYYYTCAFRYDKLKNFLGSDDKINFFQRSHRIRIVAEVLDTLIYGRKEIYEIGIERLIKENAFVAAFPPHDGHYKVDKKTDPVIMNKRQILYKYWARWGAMFKYQPLDHIREYFGDKIAIYFVWLGFYTTWLVPASITGIFVFLFGVYVSSASPIVVEICNSGNSMLMCPICDEKSGCKYWYLSITCIYTEIAYMFDHYLTVVYAVFISIWAVLFLDFWKRKSTCMAFQWNCLGFENESEVPRPDFVVKATIMETNPITGALQPSFPSKIRKTRITAGLALLALMVLLVFTFLMGIIIYKLLITVPLSRIGIPSFKIRLAANMSGAVINLIFILMIGRFYTWLAYQLTTWEMHRTQTEFDNNYIVKVFLFQFVNYYSSLFYIAFFKNKLIGYPGNYNTILGLRFHECGAGGCLVELAQQLMVIMIGKQILNNIQEILYPILAKWWNKTRTKPSNFIWESDYQLITHPGLIDEYLEMVLQFGFVTIFVAAFPLAPLFAFINNLFEIRIDAQKFLCYTRRAVPMKGETIGVWLTILQFLAHLAVISNAFIIAFTSDFIPRMVYMYRINEGHLKGFVNHSLSYSPNGSLSRECRYRDYRDREGILTPFFWHVMVWRLAFVVIFEHIVFGVIYLTQVLVPEIPEDVGFKIKREQYLGKMALQEVGKTELFKQTTLGPGRDSS